MRLLSALLLPLALTACASLSDRTREQLEAPGLEGTRWGLVVTTLDGRELIAINPDERFLPASNTKLFTVAAAFHRLGDMTQSGPRARHIPPPHHGRGRPADALPRRRRRRHADRRA